MGSSPSLLQLLFRLWGKIGTYRRWQIFGLIFLMLAASLSEVFSIGALIPFLTLLTNKSRFSLPLLSLSSSGKVLIRDFSSVELSGSLLEKEGVNYNFIDGDS